MLRSRKVKIAARRSFPANSKVMHVDRLHEQDHANHKKGYLRFSKLDDDFPLGSARHNILALPLSKRRVNNEEILSNEAILENRGSGHRFYADRNDIQNSKSPSWLEPRACRDWKGRSSVIVLYTMTSALNNSYISYLWMFTEFIIQRSSQQCLQSSHRSALSPNMSVSKNFPPRFYSSL